MGNYGAINHFSDLETWRLARKVRIAAYKIIKTLPDVEKYSLGTQLRRSATSVTANIAEGFERGSNKEFIHFLYYAKGSCSELRTQIYLANNIGIIDKEIGDKIILRTKMISGKIFNLIKVRKERF